MEVIRNKKINQELKRFIERGLEEDVGNGDHTSLACIPPDQISRARLLVKENCVISGLDVVRAMFYEVDKKMELTTHMEEGQEAEPGDIVLSVVMNSRSMLMVERLMLNTLQRMCGIATMSRKYAKAVEGFDVKILDTRKTTPQMRFLEKQAVRTGGCYNYRNGLYDRIMIKDNHVDAAGSMKKALRQVLEYLSEKDLDLKITVEVRDFEELNEAIEVGGMQRIMLDNFSVPEMQEAVQYIDGRYQVEASGGITYVDLVPVAQTGVDYISIGALTHGVKAVDLSLIVVDG